jgi:rhodanese-related sulfurtransferase
MKMSVATISPRELADRQARGEAIELIDVRTPMEFQEIHVPFARNVPLDQLDPQALMKDRNGRPLYVICRSGNRGQKACEKIQAAGYHHVVNVEGGTLAWADCNLPVVRGKKVISLQRQVQITVGSLVLLASALAWFVHPAFIALSAFFGAGLLFAGLTDTCGMAMLLAKMPWNQVRGPAPGCLNTPSGNTKTAA